MKDKFARELIEGLRREVRQDYTTQSERFGMLKAEHLLLLKYLDLEKKRVEITVKYVKRRKKNGQSS